MFEFAVTNVKPTKTRSESVRSDKILQNPRSLIVLQSSQKYVIPRSEIQSKMLGSPVADLFASGEG